MSIESTMTEFVTPLCDELGVSLYDLTFNGGVLQIAVAANDGVDVEVLKKISRKVSVFVDEEDPIPGKFTLEVTTPGLERTLRTPATEEN